MSEDIFDEDFELDDAELEDLDDEEFDELEDLLLEDFENDDLDSQVGANTNKQPPAIMARGFLLYKLELGKSILFSWLPKCTVTCFSIATGCGVVTWFYSAVSTIKRFLLIAFTAVERMFSNATNHFILLSLLCRNNCRNRTLTLLQNLL